MMNRLCYLVALFIIASTFYVGIALAGGGEQPDYYQYEQKSMGQQIVSNYPQSEPQVSQPLIEQILQSVHNTIGDVGVTVAIMLVLFITVLLSLYKVGLLGTKS